LAFLCPSDILAVQTIFMKRTLTIVVALVISTSLLAQKGKQKTKEENPNKEAKETVLGKEKKETGSSKGNKEAVANKEKGKSGHDKTIWEGTKDTDGGGPKASKNQPAKVRSAFAKDYPNATNVSWSKYRGDWTATFNNGLVTSTAIYHANGERKDTRTVVPPTQIPRTISDVLKKKSETQTTEVVKIETPKKITDVFRIKRILDGTTQFSYYDANGKEVKYDY
jgi:hypothetical protein